MVSLTIRTKSSERCDVDHVGMSGNLCKRPPLVQMKAIFVDGVVAVQTDEHPVLAVKVAWASAGASRNQPRMPMHERLVNIPTRNPQRKAGNAASSWR